MIIKKSYACIYHTRVLVRDYSFLTLNNRRLWLESRHIALLLSDQFGASHVPVLPYACSVMCGPSNIYSQKITTGYNNYVGGQLLVEEDARRLYKI
jgi:hypothetical protein